MDMSAIASKLKMPMKAESKAPSLDEDLDAEYGTGAAGADKLGAQADLTKVTLADASLEQLQMAMDKLKAASEDTEEADAELGADYGKDDMAGLV